MLALFRWCEAAKPHLASRLSASRHSHSPAASFSQLNGDKKTIVKALVTTSNPVYLFTMKNRVLLLLLGLSIAAVLVLNLSYIRLLIRRDHYQRPSDASIEHFKSVYDKIDKWDIHDKVDQIPSGGGEKGDSEGHQVAGLSCGKYGGPSDDVAAEMVYWRDIPSDATYVSPFANHGPEPKYITFEVCAISSFLILIWCETCTICHLGIPVRRHPGPLCALCRRRASCPMTFEFICSHDHLHHPFAF